ncbi:hypothetical protein BDR03DRAFT_1010470 [Suillus americanus]|nr:hypothetical protein BDR03DRAFT_1010470 [Suillus americanus]
MADHGMDVDMFLHTAPPGEEAFDLSHAGGEHEAFGGLAHQLADLTGHHHNDMQIQGERCDKHISAGLAQALALFMRPTQIPSLRS